MSQAGIRSFDEEGNLLTSCRSSCQEGSSQATFMSPIHHQGNLLPSYKTSCPEGNIQATYMSSGQRGDHLAACRSSCQEETSRNILQEEELMNSCGHPDQEGNVLPSFLHNSRVDQVLF